MLRILLIASDPLVEENHCAIFDKPGTKCCCKFSNNTLDRLRVIHSHILPSNKVLEQSG